MDKQILSQMKAMVNNNSHWETFNKYIDAVILQQYKILEQSDNTTIINRSQGAIAALRRLKILRDEVNKNVS
jgi:hypothetical protein